MSLYLQLFKADYTGLFPEHSTAVLAEVTRLVREYYRNENHSHVPLTSAILAEANVFAEQALEELRLKMYLPALPGKFQRGETVLTVHGSGKVLGLAAPGLYHVCLRDGRRVIGREEYMSHEHPMKHWNVKGESWAARTEQFCQHMADFQRRNAEELAKVKAEILARQENNQ